MTNLNDNGAGSLRRAILDANSQTGADEVRFADGLQGTIDLRTGQLSITDDLAIIGPGADRITVSGTDSSRVFEVAPAVTVHISGLTVAEGRAGIGGGIFNWGTLTASSCTLSGHWADAHGGGIFNAGTLTVSDSTLTDNIGGFASESGTGGGIHNYYGASLTVINSTLSNNQGGSGGYGGGGI